ncbi:MAG: hypothetical protein K8L99_33695 [Anaerolineae bacterium]|nr:hypothetical protein [Anaerolineae bacterium]
MQEYKKKEEVRRTGMWPLWGFLMAVACAGIAYVVGPKLIPIARQITRGGFTGNELPRDQLELAFMAFTFLVLIAVGALVVALAMPKKKATVLDTALKKEKEAMHMEEKRRRARAQIIDQRVKEENRKRAK